MKKLQIFMILIFFGTFMFPTKSFSSNSLKENSSFIIQKSSNKSLSSVDILKNLEDKGKVDNCADVTVGITLGIFTIEADITVCCIWTGLPYCCCGAGQNRVSENEPGFVKVKIEELTSAEQFKSFKEEKNKTVSVFKSTQHIIDGVKIKIKSGKYKVSKENTINLKFEILK